MVQVSDMEQLKAYILVSTVNSHCKTFQGKQTEHVYITAVHPTEIRTLISPSSAVELNTTSALANYATEAVLMYRLPRRQPNELIVHPFRGGSFHVPVRSDDGDSEYEVVELAVDVLVVVECCVFLNCCNASHLMSLNSEGAMKEDDCYHYCNYYHLESEGMVDDCLLDLLARSRFESLLDIPGFTEESLELEVSPSPCPMIVIGVLLPVQVVPICVSHVLGTRRVLRVCVHAFAICVKGESGSSKTVCLTQKRTLICVEEDRKTILEKPPSVHPMEIRISISPSSAVQSTPRGAR
uniref:(California timema) hypothetical protein n=1 Tax=Timema californicum TaxID=61474 RepID=A0A7R9JBV9_TIMCA|nr:unnamed protein product [Timema californicum]